ncbi:MAG: chorismate synthase, partial [Planctomycetota bacterium]|jgi:chorismate synthase
VARKLLALAGVSVASSVVEMAGIATDSPEALARARKEVQRVAREGDSTGGLVRVEADGLPAGLGAPVFGKLTARIGEALLSIGGVKAIEIGEGRRLAGLRGSEANDPIVASEEGARPATNRAGGLQGGITTGLPLVISLCVKPTPTVRVEQDSVDVATGEPVKISGTGRFDMNFAPRVAVVGEAMLAIVLVDALMEAGHLSPTRVEEAR